MTISVPLAQTATQARLDSTYPYASCYNGQLIYKHPLAVVKIEKEEIPLSPKILDIGVKKRS